MKVARTVLRGAALGNKCRLLDRGFIGLKFYSWHFSLKGPASSELPQGVFRTHEAIMRIILATVCCLVQHLFVQQSVAQLRNSLFRKSLMPQCVRSLIDPVPCCLPYDSVLLIRLKCLHKKDTSLSNNENSATLLIAQLPIGQL